MRPETLLKSEKTSIALEGVGEGKIRANTASWDDPKVILPGQALMVYAEGKTLHVVRVARQPAAPEPHEDVTSVSAEDDFDDA
jgi:hypothetical protein